MWKKIIKDAPREIIPQLCSTAIMSNAPRLFCSFQAKDEPENVIFVRPLEEFAGVQMDLSIFSNFCVYQNVSE